MLSVVCVDSLEAAIHFVNANDMGNGVALFTQNGGAARKFQVEWQDMVETWTKGNLAA